MVASGSVQILVRTAFSLSCTIVLAIVGAAAHAEPIVTDIFGRDDTSAGLNVPDWEGYMANPAIKFTITPPPNSVWPLVAALSTAEPRLYFDLPSRVTAQGARKKLVFPDATPQSVAIGIFPTRDKRDEETPLDIQFTDGNGRHSDVIVPIHVVVVMSHDGAKPFPVTVDFSQDRTGFYADAEHRAIFQQAVADWAFYLQDMHLHPVPAGEEKTWIWTPDGFNRSSLVTNGAPFTGFLLYAYGIKGPELRSGGEPSAAGGFQRDDSSDLPIHRSGGVETEIDGNFNTLGWMPQSVADREWWQATNLKMVQNDLYSIVHHEIGHALFFNPINLKYPRDGVLKNAAIRAYLGSDIKTGIHDHFDGFVDPVSLHGAFGNEYHGKTPLGRWLITKLDLLCLEAEGYKLRSVAPLLPLSLQVKSLPDAPLLRKYQARLVAQGGVPVYDWSLERGNLPSGLALDRFTGQITGTADRAGRYSFTVKVRDYDPAGDGVTQSFRIIVPN